ncbi:MAG: type II toxin-antitoxin system HicA family toxin [Candidatus Berkelbacteria bacterium]|nr:type II toxin-antitoxin system HicA family toxin [Candidatus Berkelbacteria bacterium]
MPSHSELPGEIKRPKFLRTCKRLGFVVDRRGGDGSHFKLVWPKNNKMVTIPEDLPKQTLKYIIKEIMEISNLDWDDIKKEL